VPVEALKLNEKPGVGKITVNDANRVAFIHRRHQGVPGVFDGFHVARGDKAGRADQGKVFHHVESGIRVKG